MTHSSKACEKALESLQECFPSLVLPSYSHGQSLDSLLNVLYSLPRALHNCCPFLIISPSPFRASNLSVTLSSTASSVVNWLLILSPRSIFFKTSARKFIQPTWVASQFSAAAIYSSQWMVTWSTRCGGRCKRKMKASILSIDRRDIYSSIIRNTNHKKKITCLITYWWKLIE